MKANLIADKVIYSYEPSSKTIDSYFKYLAKAYGFGDPQKKDHNNRQVIQDVFDIAIRPVLQHCIKHNDIDLYSLVDHHLFLSYICPFEDSDWFNSAFWNVNTYGNALAENIKPQDRQSRSSTDDERNLLIILKGPNRLAHSEVLKDFIDGSKNIDKLPNIYVLFLDAKPPAKRIKNINYISFFSAKLTSDKVKFYLQLTEKIEFYNIVWVACVQNLMLYMGLKRGINQTYWTMKRHSIVHPKLNKYATVVSSYRNSEFNNAYWFGGRYRLKTNYSKKAKEQITSVFPATLKAKISQSSSIIGSFARPQKYMSLDYWKGIDSLLRRNPAIFFIYGTTELPEQIRDYINSSMSLSSRSHNFGWLGGKTSDLCSLIDIYIDNIPFASGMTASQCVWAGGVYLGTESHINRESSFINILFDAYLFETNSRLDENKKILKSIGISENFEQTLNLTELILNNKKIGEKIHLNQIFLLQRMHATGEKYFTKDYLGFFVDEKFC